MVTLEQSTIKLKEKIKADIDTLDSDKIREIYNFISNITSNKAIKIANKAWDKKRISRDKISHAIKTYRKNKDK